MNKPKELTNITDAAAIRLYKNALEELRSRGHDSAGVREMLRCAAQWTQEAGDAQRSIAKIRKAGDEDGKAEARIRAQLKVKALCESECRKILDDLMLTPQRPRGRPPKADEPEGEEDDGGWSDFDNAPPGGDEP